MRICSVENCEEKHIAKGYCSKHYMQIRLYGKILERTIFDPNEFFVDGDICWITLYNIKNVEVARAKIDTKYYEIIKNSDLKWHLTYYGYAAAEWFDECGKTQQTFLHQAIIQLSGQKMEDDQQIDHKDVNKLNCLEDNLRICTTTQNNHNVKIRKNNTSGATGVWWNQQVGKYEVHLAINGKQKYHGSFKTKGEAIKFYNELVIKYHGEFAVLNEASEDEKLKS